jgi:23S rRNA (cytosine1962-C5)-methyltransferase
VQGKVYLKKGRAKPIFEGHPWIFSGAVERIEGEPRDGDVVEVCGDRGDRAGIGFLNRKSQIVVRMLAAGIQASLESDFPAGRIRKASRMRRETLGIERFGDAWRVVYAEADGLPGLVVDKYGDVLSVQFHTLGVELLQREILDTLEEEFQPRAILDRSDPAMRKNEGLPLRRETLRGSLPGKTVTISENGLRFLVDVEGGQKTGYYLDQRENRSFVKGLAGARRVLDTFCYTGGFAIHAAAGGAREVLGIESSEKFVETATENAALNGFPSIRFVKGDALAELSGLAGQGEKFDLVILDPPKLAHGAATLKKALTVFREYNRLALRLLGPGGVLATCSCSHHVTEADLEDTVRRAALETGRGLSLFHRGGQAADHPVSLFCPESRYLKCLFLYVS